jgi:hypothetical protein
MAAIRCPEWSQQIDQAAIPTNKREGVVLAMIRDALISCVAGTSAQRQDAAPAQSA